MSDNPYAPQGGGFNPYQAPSIAADGFGPAIQPNVTGYWREGDLLVVTKGASLPAEVCVATGLRSDGKLIHKKLQWAHPAVAVAILFNVIIYVILYLVLRKTGEISYALSPDFRSRRMIGVMMAIFGPVLSIGLIAAGIEARGFEWLAIVGALAIIGTLIAGIVIAQPFRVQKIDEHRVYLKVKPAVFTALGL